MIYLLGPGVRIIGYYLSWSLNSWGESNNIKVSDVNMTLTAFPPLFGNNSAQNAPARAEEGSIVLYRQPRPRLGLSRHPLLKFIHSRGYCRMLAHFPQTWESRPNIYFAHSLPWESARGTCFHKSIVSNFSREIIITGKLFRKTKFFINYRLPVDISVMQNYRNYIFPEFIFSGN